jgi:hypothetical protein
MEIVVMKQLAPILSVLVFASPILLAQDAGTQDVKPVDWNGSVWEAKTHGDQVTVRSGPSENYYPVTRLADGVTVTVAGISGDWVRIVPPADAFSLVAKKFVTVAAGGTTGKVAVSSLNARAGSLLNSRFETIQTKLTRGESVTILGEVKLGDETYYKIKPPAGAYLFVRKDLVVPVRKLDSSVLPPEPKRGGVSGTASNGIPPAKPTTRAKKPVVDVIPAEPEMPTTVPAPTTQEVVAATARAEAEKAYADVDQGWQEVASKPIEEQPIPEYLAKFEALADNENLPVTLRQQAAANATFLKNRLATRDEIIAAKKRQAEMEEKLRPLKEETEKLNAKFKELDMSTFNAIGQLQTSQLAEGGHALLRLVDPTTGRTLIYLSTADQAMVGQFVGVKGDVATDDALNVKIITPRAVVLVDPNAVGKGVSAEVMPPSMRPAAPATTQP